MASFNTGITSTNIQGKGIGMWCREDLQQFHEIVQKVFLSISPLFQDDNLMTEEQISQKHMD